jgi:hypothetical protein
MALSADAAAYITMNLIIFQALSSSRDFLRVRAVLANAKT